MRVVDNTTRHSIKYSPTNSISNAITLNRYAYANGNPVSFVDPFGLMSQEALYNKLTRDEKKYYDLEKQIISEKARKSKLTLDEEMLSSTIYGKPKTASTQYKKALLDETRMHGNPFKRSPRYDKLTLDEKKFQEHAAKYFNTDISYYLVNNDVCIGTENNTKQTFIVTYDVHNDIIKTMWVEGIKIELDEISGGDLVEIGGMPLSSYISVAETAINIGNTINDINQVINDNKNNGNSWQETVSDVGIEIVGATWNTAWGVIGASIGTAIFPGPGTVYGAAFGAVLGAAFTSHANTYFDNYMKQTFDDYYNYD